MIGVPKVSWILGTGVGGVPFTGGVARGPRGRTTGPRAAEEGLHDEGRMVQPVHSSADQAAEARAAGSLELPRLAGQGVGGAGGRCCWGWKAWWKMGREEGLHVVIRDGRSWWRKRVGLVESGWETGRETGWKWLRNWLMLVQNLPAACCCCPVAVAVAVAATVVVACFLLLLLLLFVYLPHAPAVWNILIMNHAWCYSQAVGTVAQSIMLMQDV